MSLGLQETICYQGLLYKTTAISPMAWHVERYHWILATKSLLSRSKEDTMGYMLAWIRPHAFYPVSNPPKREVLYNHA
jgi:hypothetical protein